MALEVCPALALDPSKDQYFLEGQLNIQSINNEILDYKSTLENNSALKAINVELLLLEKTVSVCSDKLKQFIHKSTKTEQELKTSYAILAMRQNSLKELLNWKSMHTLYKASYHYQKDKDLKDTWIKLKNKPKSSVLATALRKKCYVILRGEQEYGL